MPGTPYAMSPELCQSEPYSYKSDVWALGCIFFELLALKRAFEGVSLMKLVWNIVQEPHAVLPDNYSQELRALVKYGIYIGGVWIRGIWIWGYAYIRTVTSVLV